MSEKRNILISIEGAIWEYCGTCKFRCPWRNRSQPSTYYQERWPECIAAEARARESRVEVDDGTLEQRVGDAIMYDEEAPLIDDVDIRRAARQVISMVRESLVEVPEEVRDAIERALEVATVLAIDEVEGYSTARAWLTSLPTKEGA